MSLHLNIFSCYIESEIQSKSPLLIQELRERTCHIACVAVAKKGKGRGELGAHAKHVDRVWSVKRGESYIPPPFVLSALSTCNMRAGIPFPLSYIVPAAEATLHNVHLFSMVITYYIGTQFSLFYLKLKHFLFCNDKFLK